MSTILKMLKRFEAVNTDQIIEDVMTDAQDPMADLNAEQINTGQRADGSMMPDYSPVSVDFFGKPAGPIRLRETGKFQAGMYARLQGSSIVFNSTDEKADMLSKQYGNQVFGLNDKFKLEAVRDSIRPGVKQKIFDATGLIMKK
jgi:hypothetical protein